MCNNVFTTLEKAELASAIVVKNTEGQLQPLERDTLLLTVYESCKHRPQALSDASHLTNTIISDIVRAIDTQGVIEAKALHTLAHDVLKRFDPVAGTIYKAYQKI